MFAHKWSLIFFATFICDVKVFIFAADDERADI
jgi:hypothetical protein